MHEKFHLKSSVGSDDLFQDIHSLVLQKCSVFQNSTPSLEPTEHCHKSWQFSSEASGFEKFMDGRDVIHVLPPRVSRYGRKSPMRPFSDSQAVPSFERDRNRVPKFSINPKRNSFIESIHLFRTDGAGKYTRSKSPNIFNRKTIESSTPAASKQNAPSHKLPQRARTASMPGENRKVTEKFCLVFYWSINWQRLFIRYDQPVGLIFMHSVMKIRSVDFSK